MHKYRITSLLLFPLMHLMSMDAQATQPVTLVIPEALDIVSVDNVKHSGSLFSGGDASLKLQAGQHKIVLEYDVLIEIGADDHDVITSAPFQITFSTAAGEQYYIKVPAFNEDSLDKARAYARKPVIELIDRATNQAVAAEITYREFDGSFSRQATKPSTSSAPKPSGLAAAFMATSPAASTATSPKTDRQTTSHMPLKMLEYWWQQASEQQRQQFLETR